MNKIILFFILIISIFGCSQKEIIDKKNTKQIQEPKSTVLKQEDTKTIQTFYYVDKFSDSYGFPVSVRK